jgi:hypothetical protein
MDDYDKLKAQYDQIKAKEEAAIIARHAGRMAAHRCSKCGSTWQGSEPLPVVCPECDAPADDHEHQFPEVIIEGERVLYPCLLCSLAALDAMAQMKEASNDGTTTGADCAGSSAPRTVNAEARDHQRALSPRSGNQEATAPPVDAACGKRNEGFACSLPPGHPGEHRALVSFSEPAVFAWFDDAPTSVVYPRIEDESATSPRVEPADVARALGAEATAPQEPEPQPCPDCGGSGQVVLGERFVTRDMASDACEPAMEGMSLGPEWGPCPACDGGGLAPLPLPPERGSA